MRGVRRAFATLVLVGILTVPAVALASRQDANDGTLSVRNGVGKVWIGARGAVIGRFDSGSVRIFDPADGDPVDVEVWGAEHHRDITDTTEVYSGQNVRFRIVGRFRITVTGADVDLSAVGQGRIGLRGNDADGPDGTFWINDGPRRSLPNPITDDPFYAFYDLNASG
jgi:hypothetical protein